MRTPPFVNDPDFRLYVGDVLEVLRELPDGTVDCCATSPPFWGLRDYGVDGQIGLEASPEEWVARLVAVFSEVRRVLKPEGTLWIECGDSYCANDGQQKPQAGHVPNSWSGHRQGVTPIKHPTKPKDLLGQPWMLAFALRADGWWLRQAIIWHKPNAMPESATDRCTTAHSYVFLLSKQARYWFDAEAISEPAEWARWGDQTVPKYEGTDTATGWMQPKTKGELRALRTPYGSWESGGLANGKSSWPYGRKEGGPTEGATKNARSVWTIATEGYPEAHFATWPQALVERILKAGCPPGGVVLDPFSGSGTTALVARKLGRRSIGIELNPDYCTLAAKRLGQLSLLAAGEGNAARGFSFADRVRGIPRR